MDELGAASSRVEALSLLATQAGAVWTTARRYTDLAHWSKRLEYQANHDALTGLANRACVMERLRQMVSVTRRGGPVFGLLYLDLNGSKKVNDTLGHDAGDGVLKAVSQRLRGIARPGHLVARLGGDEFVVLVPAPGDLAAMIDIARRVCIVLSVPVTVGEDVCPIGTSVGVAIGDGSQEADEVMRLGDEAMYRAKRMPRSAYALARGLTPPPSSAPGPAGPGGATPPAPEARADGGVGVGAHPRAHGRRLGAALGRLQGNAAPDHEGARGARCRAATAQGFPGRPPGIRQYLMDGRGNTSRLTLVVSSCSVASSRKPPRAWPSPSPP